ncbi:fumarylacetoacetate hydrolase family protein [Streptomyces sp. NPDC059454]|uniref:fumarylacetoacetate hydrolase family protein n=1 Tax=Streptomyces sp. NPDC059454 TaxID=3346836 RepID=UPI0036C542F1
MSPTPGQVAACASRSPRMTPADVLGSGTCGNGGCPAGLWGPCVKRAPQPLKPGDTVTLTAEGIGTLFSALVPGVPPVPPPAGRRTEGGVRTGARPGGERGRHLARTGR